MTVKGRGVEEGGSMLRRKGWWYQDMEGSDLLQMDSNTEVQCVCVCISGAFV